MSLTVFNQEFLTDITQILRKDNAFTQLAKNRSAYLSGRIVNKPGQGADPTININPGSLPLTISERTDTNFSWTTDKFITSPTLVESRDELHTNYDKRGDVIRQHSLAIAEEIADYTAYNWVRDYAGTDGDSGGDIGAGAKLLTSGANGTNNNPNGDAARKLATIDDIKRCALVLDKQNVSKSGRYALLPAEMYYEIFDTTNVRYNINQGGQQQFDGVLGVHFGITFLNRSSVVYSNAGVVQAPGTAITTAFDHTAIIWQQDAVNYAMGDGRFYVQTDRGEYGGTIANAEMFHASHRERTDAKGIVTLTQASTI